jgi:hypothetical protein
MFWSISKWQHFVMYPACNMRAFFFNLHGVSPISLLKVKPESVGFLN